MRCLWLEWAQVTDIYEPTDLGEKSKAFISAGYDATTNFETVMTDVMAMYTRITGKTLDLEEPEQ